MRNRQLLFAISLIAAVVLFAFVRLYSLPNKKAAAPTEAEPPVGVPCAIELRPPLPGGLSYLYVKGTLKQANDRWLVIANDERPNEGETWIPRESVVWVVVGEGARSYKGIDLRLKQ